MVALENVRPKLVRRVAPVEGRLRAAFDRDHFHAVAASLAGEQVRRRDPLDVYLSSDKFRTLPPNPYFDEIYYRRTYSDVARTVYEGVFLSGLHHYVAYGAAEGRMPNPDFERRVRRAEHSPPLAHDVAEVEPLLTGCQETAAFLKLFPFIDQLDFYNTIGRHLVRAAASSGFRAFVEETLDRDFYCEQAGLAPGLHDRKIVDHYLFEGLRRRLSPHPAFDEAFYLAFHDDIREALERGSATFKSGYEHWFLAGRREQRLPKHDLGATLEARFGGITEPVGIARVAELEQTIKPPPVREVDRRERVLHILVPDLNPDIFFGGYHTLVELMKYLLRTGHRLSVVKTSRDTDGLDYFFYHLDEEQRELFRNVPATCRRTQVEVGPNDRFLAYSGWDALRASRMLEATNCRRFSFLVQEYEPVFIDHNSVRFLLASAYETPHFAIFNSEPLKTFFARNRIGVFRGDGARDDGHTVFEHVLSGPSRDRPADARPPRSRTFFVYARPEAHAGRNLFEVAVMALRRALERVELRNRWEFVGAGALSPLPDVPLTREHTLRLHSRLPRDEYAALLERTFAGLSLMYAPHPSLVPFELASNGAITVTNTYANRDTDFFGAISDAIIPVDLTLDAVVDGIVEALERADALAHKPPAGFHSRWATSWDEACSRIAARLRAEDLL